MLTYGLSKPKDSTDDELTLDSESSKQRVSMAPQNNDESLQKKPQHYNNYFFFYFISRIKSCLCHV